MIERTGIPNYKTHVSGDDASAIRLTIRYDETAPKRDIYYLEEVLERAIEERGLGTSSIMFHYCQHYSDKQDSTSKAYYDSVDNEHYRISILIDEYIKFKREMIQSMKVDKTEDTARSHLELLIRCLGSDIPAPLVTRDHMEDVLKKVKILPRRYPSDKKFSGKEPDYFMKHPPAENELKSAKTVNTMMDRFNDFFKWCLQRRICHYNPCEGLRVSEEGKPHMKRVPLLSEHIVKFAQIICKPIVAPKEYKLAFKRGAYAYWVLPLGLLTGMRRSEIFNLRAGDLKYYEAGKFFYIDIRADEGRRVKTEASNRLVPLHPDLDRLGFVEFVKFIEQKRGSEALLFKGTPAAYSNFFARIFDTYIDDDKRFNFHSTRRNLISDLHRRRPNDNCFLKDIVGHARNNDIDELVYIGPTKLAEAYELLKDVDYGIDFVEVFGTYREWCSRRR